MRRGRSTLVLLVVLIGLGAYVFLVDRARPAPSPVDGDAAAALNVPADKIQEVTIALAGGDVTTIANADASGAGKWRMTLPAAADVDEAALAAITRSIGNLQVRRVVDEHPSDLTQYGLDPPRIDVRVKARDRSESHLLFGDRAPAGDELYAKAASEPRVFLVPASAAAAFDKDAWGLRDKAVLEFDPAGVDAVELVASSRRTRLVKRDLEWFMTQPLDVAADPGMVADLMMKLANEQMQSLVTADSADGAKYGLNPPAYTVVVEAHGSRATLEVGKPADASTLYARDASRQMVFTIGRALVDTLARQPWEFRRKDLFAFQEKDATRVEVARGGRTAVYEREGEGAGVQDRWREASPGARTVDQKKMEPVLHRLSLLRAVSFADRASLKAGSEASTFSVIVTYKDSSAGRVQTEQVTLSATGAEAFGARGDWPDAARLDPSAYRLLVEALDDLSR